MKSRQMHLQMLLFIITVESDLWEQEQIRKEAYGSVGRRGRMRKSHQRAQVLC